MSLSPIEGLGEQGAERLGERIEYAHTLHLRKTAVPVYKEDFVLSPEKSLPEDVQGVLRLNAIKWRPEYREACMAKLRAALSV